MYNQLKYVTKKAQVPQEKYLRQNPLGSKVENKVQISEKKLPHRGKKDLNTITEDQFNERKTASDNMILEKSLNKADSPLVEHRRDNNIGITVPPLNVLVEKMRQARMNDYKTKKESNWTVSFNDKTQLGELPKWPKSPSQHTKKVLNNDPNRFKNTENIDPTKINKDDVSPLLGTEKITLASMHKVCSAIKTGKTLDYDTAIVAILKQAESEKRELNTIERKAICKLKTERTNYLLHNA